VRYWVSKYGLAGARSHGFHHPDVYVSDPIRQMRRVRGGIELVVAGAMPDDLQFIEALAMVTSACTVTHTYLDG
jgi:hypothetical protein